MTPALLVEADAAAVVNGDPVVIAQEAGSRAWWPQAVIIARAPGRTPVPAGQELAALAAHGRPASTPAAWIATATRPEQRVVVGTLGDLAVRVGDPQDEAPALVIVGEVVALRARLLALAGAAGRAS